MQTGRGWCRPPPCPLTPGCCISCAPILCGPSRCPLSCLSLLWKALAQLPSKRTSNRLGSLFRAHPSCSLLGACFLQDTSVLELACHFPLILPCLGVGLGGTQAPSWHWTCAWCSPGQLDRQHQPICPRLQPSTFSFLHPCLIWITYVESQVNEVFCIRVYLARKCAWLQALSVHISTHCVQCCGRGVPAQPLEAICCLQYRPALCPDRSMPCLPAACPLPACSLFHTITSQL